LCDAGESRAGGKIDIDPGGIRQDGRVDGFDEALRLVGQEVAVRVEAGVHVGVQFPERGEAQSPAASQQHPQEAQ
jgi:hypothetical protein